VYRGFTVVQRARVNRVVDLILGQPELQAGGLVAERCALALPFFHSDSPWLILVAAAAESGRT